MLVVVSPRITNTQPAAACPTLPLLFLLPFQFPLPLPPLPPLPETYPSMCTHEGTNANVSTTGADTDDSTHDEEPPRGRGRNKQLAPPLQIPKNRSTASLGSVSEHPESEGHLPSSSRVRFSFDAGSGLSTDYDSITRCDDPLPLLCPCLLAPSGSPSPSLSPPVRRRGLHLVCQLVDARRPSHALVPCSQLVLIQAILPCPGVSSHLSFCLVICCLAHLSTPRPCVAEKRNHPSCT